MTDAALRRQLNELLADITPVLETEGDYWEHQFDLGEAEQDEQPIDETPMIPDKPATTEESMDALRITVKYLLLDLESTRRENEYLRMLLEEEENPLDLDGDDSDFEDFI